jgi:hypothetical protein
LPAKEISKRERERIDKNIGSTYFVGKRELLDRKRTYLERGKRERLHKRKERKKPDGKRNHKLPAKEVTDDWIREQQDRRKSRTQKEPSKR